MAIKEFLKQHVLLVDGAMGTQIQERHPGAAAWGACEGCNEWLNLSAGEPAAGLAPAELRAICAAAGIGQRWF